ncbi:MAG: transglutaminase-like domain-containing protein [Myxococcota bacterium]
MTASNDRWTLGFLAWVALGLVAPQVATAAPIAPSCMATLRARIARPPRLLGPPGLSQTGQQQLAVLRRLVAGRPYEVRLWADRQGDGAVVQLRREALFETADGKVAATSSVYLSADEDDGTQSQPGFVVAATLFERGRPTLHVHDGATVGPGCRLARTRRTATTVGVGDPNEVLVLTELADGSTVQSFKKTSEVALAGAGLAARLIAGEPDPLGERTTQAFYSVELTDVTMHTGAVRQVRERDPWTGEDAAFDVQPVDLLRGGKPFFHFDVGRSGSSPFRYRRYPSLQTESVRLPQGLWGRLVLAERTPAVVMEGVMAADFDRDALPLEVVAPHSLDFDNASAYYELKSVTQEGGAYRYQLVLRHGPTTPAADVKAFDPAPWLAETDYYQLRDPRIRELAAEILARGGQGRRELTERVLQAVVDRLTFDYAMASGNACQPIRSSEILARSSGVCQHFAGLFVTLARAVGVPARQINGLRLGTQGAGGAGWHAWVEVSLDDRTWLPLEPQHATPGLSDLGYLPFGVAVVYETGSAVALPAGSLGAPAGLVGEKVRVRGL